MTKQADPSEFSPRYPPSTVRSLLATAHVSPATRRALQDRLDAPAVSAPDCLSSANMSTLRAVCDRLIPQDDCSERVDIAGQIDQRLAAGQSNGWRPAAMPLDPVAWTIGLDAIEESCQQRYTCPFGDLSSQRQEAFLRDLQTGAVQGVVWRGIDPAGFFTAILAAAVEIFYASPLAQEEIGYVGMADLPDWTTIGLNELSAREPRPRDTPLD